MSSKGYYKSEDTEKNSTYSSSSERSHLHRESVRENIEQSVKNDLISRYQYTEEKRSYYNTENQTIQSNNPFNIDSSVSSHRDESKQPINYKNETTNYYSTQKGYVEEKQFSYNNKNQNVQNNGFSHKNNFIPSNKNESKQPVNYKNGTANYYNTQKEYVKEKQPSYNNKNQNVQNNGFSHKNNLIPSNKSEWKQSVNYKIESTNHTKLQGEISNLNISEDYSKQKTNIPYNNNSEKNNYKNDVEQFTKKESRYGTIEQNKSTKNIGSGVTSISSSTDIFKNNNRSIFKTSINTNSSEAIKESIKVSQSVAFAEKAWGKNTISEKKGLASTIFAIAGKEIELSIGSGDVNSNLDERAKVQAQKYGYKAGKYAVLGGTSFIKESVKLGVYGKKLHTDVADGLLNANEAKKLLSVKLKSNILNSGKAMTSILKSGTIHAIEDFKGSDDLGIKSITKTKDIVVSAKRTFKMVNATGKTIKKTFTTTKKVINKVQQASRLVMALGKKILANPVVLKGIGIAVLSVIIVAVVISVVSSVTSLLPTLSLKSEDYELSQVYLYITELDARMQEDIFNEDTKLHIPSIDEYHYYFNGVSTSKEQMEVYTNADLVLTYLDSKYEDYKFDGIINGLFGTTVKGELEFIHSSLHQVDKTRWTETIRHRETSTDPLTGESSSYTWYEYVYHMDISLTTISWEDYYEENKDTLLTPDEQQQYESLKEVGIYIFKQQLTSPFVGIDWSTGVSSRWGWRIDPIKGVLSNHKGLDIAMPGGTPINACNSGIVTLGDNPNGWGNYIKVTMANGDYTLYGHMSGFAVSNGQNVKSGDVIGYVGTTGASTGNHLHLEYYKNGKNLNPLIFTECEK